MKKVRMVGIVAGAAAVPAATLAGAAPAQAAVAHLNAGTTAAVTPAVTCRSTVTFSSTSPGRAWTGYVWGLSGCAAKQEGVLWRSQTGVTERVRYRNSGNQLLYQARLGGTISGGATWFWSNKNLYAYICWQAAVRNGTSTIINNGNALVGTLVP
jgi:hypothetical protein